MKNLMIFASFFIASISQAQTLSYGEFWNDFSASRRVVRSGLSCTQMMNTVMQMQIRFASLNERDRIRAANIIESQIYDNANFKRCLDLGVTAPPQEAQARFNIYEENTIPVTIENGECSSSISLAQGTDVSVISVLCYLRGPARRLCSYFYYPNQNQGSFHIADHSYSTLPNHPILEVTGSRTERASSSEVFDLNRPSTRNIQASIQSTMTQYCNDEAQTDQVSSFDDYSIEINGLGCNFDTSSFATGSYSRALYCNPENSAAQCVVRQSVNSDGTLSSFEGQLNSYDPPVQFVGDSRPIGSIAGTEADFLDVARSWMQATCSTSNAPATFAAEIETDAAN